MATWRGGARGVVTWMLLTSVIASCAANHGRSSSGSGSPSEGSGAAITVRQPDTMEGIVRGACGAIDGPLQRLIAHVGLLTSAASEPAGDRQSWSDLTVNLVEPLAAVAAALKPRKSDSVSAALRSLIAEMMRLRSDVAARSGLIVQGDARATFVDASALEKACSDQG
jgi:hypothetical protein